MKPSREVAVVGLLKTLLSEILRCLLFRQAAELACAALRIRDPLILPRPVELADVAYAKANRAWRGDTIVYPDPPVDEVEQRLIAAIAGRLKVRTLGQLGTTP